MCCARVRDKGSRQRCARVEVQGVEAWGVVDTGADITIMGGELFKKVATVARLKDFKPADKKPYTYGDRPFKLDGRMDLVLASTERRCALQYILRWIYKRPYCCQKEFADSLVWLPTTHMLL